MNEATLKKSIRAGMQAEILSILEYNLAAAKALRVIMKGKDAIDDTVMNSIIRVYEKDIEIVKGIKP